MTHRDIRDAMERDWPTKQSRYLAWCYATGWSVTADGFGAAFIVWLNQHVGQYKTLTRSDCITDQDAFTDYLWRNAVEEREGQQTLEGMD